METTEAADIHGQGVSRAAGADVTGSTQIDGQVVGGQVRQSDRPGAANGQVQTSGLQFPDCQGPGAWKIHLLQILHGHADHDRPGGGHAPGPIRLAVLDVEGAARDTRGELRDQIIIGSDCQRIRSALLDGEFNRVIYLDGIEFSQLAGQREPTTPEPRTEPLKSAIL